MIFIKKLDIHSVAMTFGLLLSGWHALWGLLVFTGRAQELINFAFWMHMLSPAPRVMAFNSSQFLTLLVVTFLAGYGAGWAFAVVWNKMHR